MIVGPAREMRNPEEQLEDHDLRGEEAHGQGRDDAGEDGDSGLKKPKPKVVA
jgi:hypothetical protein